MKNSRRKVRKLMDDLHSADVGSKISTKQHTQASKKRGVAEKVVVAVKIEENDEKHSEGAPDDCWSWRKYGQKPIKGSPYPRGYYKCSTSKSCSAKKQVEKCRTNASLLIITYTCTHDHLAPPELSSTNQSKTLEENENVVPTPTLSDAHSATPHQQDQETLAIKDAHNINVQVLQQQGQSYSHSTTLSAPQTTQEGNDFYDELEELPTSSYFTTFMRREFLEKKILVNPP